MVMELIVVLWLLGVSELLTKKRSIREEDRWREEK